MDTLDCLKYLILDGKSVRFSDLGLFSIGMTSRGEVSKEKVTAATVLAIVLSLGGIALLNHTEGGASLSTLGVTLVMISC